MISIRDLHEGSRRQTVRAIRPERKLSLYPPSLSCHKQWAAAPAVRLFHAALRLSKNRVKYQTDSFCMFSPHQEVHTLKLSQTLTAERAASFSQFTVMSQAQWQTVIKGLTMILDQCEDVIRPGCIDEVTGSQVSASPPCCHLAGSQVTHSS